MNFENISSNILYWISLANFVSNFCYKAIYYFSSVTLQSIYTITQSIKTNSNTFTQVV